MSVQTSGNWAADTANIESSAASATVATATVATFAKSFVPFQFFGSTEIFVASLLLCIASVAMNSRLHVTRAWEVKTELLLITAFYALVVANFLVVSGDDVPSTYLVGTVTFLPMFLALGFVTALRMKLLAWILLSASAIYVFFLSAFILTQGDVYQDGYFADVFGLGRMVLLSGADTSQLYQNVGIYLALGALSAAYLCADLSSVIKKALISLSLCTAVALTILVQARGAAAGLIFALSIRSRWYSRNILGWTIIISVLAGLLLFVFADDLEHLPIWVRTINELSKADPPPNTRIAIYSFALKAIWMDPASFIFGRGFGMFPIDYGYRPPDWLLASPSASLYPHNSILEALYELGVVGATLYAVSLAKPMIVGMNATKTKDAWLANSCFLMFVLMEMFSGALAYSYPFVFFLGLLLGAIADSRRQQLTVEINTKVPTALLRQLAL
ncbi:O-antigen ligase family protein [Bradyrhizobium sp. UFLA05-153]